MLRKAIAIGLVSLALPVAAMAHPAPRDPEPPQKAHGQFGIGLAFTKPAGAIVMSVYGDSPASRAGLLKGDVLVTIDGHAVHDPDGALERIAACRPGSVVPVIVSRDGKGKTVYVKPSHKGPETSAAADIAEQAVPSTGVVEGVGEELITDW